MKLPTKEELWREFTSSTLGMRDNVASMLTKYVALAEEEARREALKKVRDLLFDRRAEDWCVLAVDEMMRGFKAAPATAEAGKDAQRNTAQRDAGAGTGEAQASATGDGGNTRPPGSRSTVPEGGRAVSVAHPEHVERARSGGMPLSQPDTFPPPAPPPSKAVTEEPGGTITGPSPYIEWEKRKDEAFEERVRAIAESCADAVHTDLVRRIDGARHNDEEGHKLHEKLIGQLQRKFLECNVRLAALESAAKTALHHNPDAPPIPPDPFYVDLGQARSAAGGKTGEDDPMAVEREEMHKAMSAEACMKAWRRNFDRGREAGIREAKDLFVSNYRKYGGTGLDLYVKHLDRLMDSPAALEGSVA